MPLPRSLLTSTRSAIRLTGTSRSLPHASVRWNSTSSFVDVQHSELLARAGDKPRIDVDKDNSTQKEVKRRAEELTKQDDTSRWTGKLTPTTSHLFKLVLPLPRSLAELQSAKGASSTTGDNADGVAEPTGSTTNPIETAYLLHPSQPLSHVSRLILGSLPSSERSAEVEFRAVSGRDHDAYPSATSEPSHPGRGDGVQQETVGPEGGPILNDRNPQGEDLQEVRWSTSTDLGDFIKQSTLAQSFRIVVRPEEARGQTLGPQGVEGKGKAEAGRPLTLKVKIPTFASRTVYLRRRLLKLTTEIAKMTDQKKW